MLAGLFQARLLTFVETIKIVGKTVFLLSGEISWCVVESFEVRFSTVAN